MTTFKDIFKSSFLERTFDITPFDMALSLGLALVLGLFIFFVYKKTFNGIMYSSGFAASLLGITLITTFIIVTVTSNVVLSLGMVGALSIVRFRTAIKEPLDITFLFWAISVGIVVGAGFIALAVGGTIFIGLVLLILTSKRIADNPYILVVNYSSECDEGDVNKLIKENVRKYIVKSKSVSAGNTELTIEVKLRKDMSTKFVNDLSIISGVKNAVLVSFNGEYMS